MSKDDARNRILDAAGPIFAEKGFDTATVREICQQAGANVAAVNYYFGDKERLYIEAVKRAHHPDEEPEPLLEWPESTPPQMKLKLYIRGMMERMLSERSVWQRQLMMREMLHPTAACRELVQVYVRRRFDQLQEILDEILPAETPPARRHQIGFSIIAQGLHYHVAGEIVTLLVGQQERSRHYQLDQLAEHITQFTAAALGLAPPLAGDGRGENQPEQNSILE